MELSRAQRDRGAAGAVEGGGGVAELWDTSDAVEEVDDVGDAGRDVMATSASGPCGSVAMAVQRGNAMTFLEGYDRALHAALAKHAASAKQKAVVEQEEDDRGIETTESEGESEDEHDDEEDDGSEEE